LTTALQVFEYDGHRVRTTGSHEAPLFCAADVCAILGLDDVRRACERLDHEDVTLEHHGAAENKQNGVTDGRTIRGVKRSLYVTESGLYALIFGSEKPEAKAFKRWVTGTVLPEIRKRGYFDAVEVQQRKQTELLLAACFPNAPSKVKPIFSDLIAALLKMRNEQRVGNPPWAPFLAQLVYDWALPIDGQQAKRRELNWDRTANRTDHSMLSPEASAHVIDVARAGIALAKNSLGWNQWRASMDTAFHDAPLQLSMLTPVKRLPPKKPGHTDTEGRHV
jgi:prophage antirepressor-like protein